MEVARHVQNTQNNKLVIFLEYIRKNVATALCSIVMQNIEIFYRGPVMFVITCFSQIDVISIIEINRNIFNPLEYASIDFVKPISQEMINL